MRNRTANPGSKNVFSKNVFLYMKSLDSFTEDGVRPLIGRKVVDVDGKEIGALRRIWLDPSTYQVEFAGVGTGWLFPSARILAARDIRLDEQSGLFQVGHPAEFIRKAPRSNPRAELSEVEKTPITVALCLFAE
jgi:sporulation protein YlmC with PRC-barrel domain